MEQDLQAASKNGNQRLSYIDVSKGFVIFLVVLGHTITFGGVAFALIFSFHMPFFFIVSGWCRAFSETKKPFGKVLLDAVRKLVIPCIVFRLIYFYDIGDFAEYMKKVFLNPYAEWFLPTLFAVTILLYIFKQLDEMLDLKRFGIAITLFLVAVTPVFVKYIIRHGFHMKIGFPVSVDTVLIAFTFTLIGYYLYQIYQLCGQIKFNLPKVIIILVALAVTLMCVLANAYVNVCDAQLGTYHTMTYFAATFLSLLTMKGASLLESASNHFLPRWLCKLLQLWGRYSLWIFLGHSLLFKYFNLFLSAHSITLHHYLHILLYCAIPLTILTPMFILADYIKKKRKKSDQTS